MNYSQRIDDIIIKNINMTKINFTLDNNFDLDISNEILKSENLDLNNRLNEITRLVYCQDWNKLHKINKKIKVEEFFSQLILKMIIMISLKYKMNLLIGLKIKI